MKQESGGGESWNIQGHVCDSSLLSNWCVEGYYGSQGRKGQLRFVVPTKQHWDAEGQTFMIEVDTELDQQLEADIHSVMS